VAKKRIEIVITAASRGLQRGLRGAVRMIGDFVNDLKNMGSAGVSAFNALSQGLFFLTANIRTAIEIGRGLFDLFISGAAKAERLEVVLRNMTGSADLASQMMAHMDEVSQTLGLSWDEVAMGGQQMAAAAKDAQGNFDIDLWMELLEITQNLSALRPDVPFQLMARGVTAAVAGDMGTLTRLLDVNVNQLLGLQDAADEVLATGGRLTGLVEVAGEGAAGAAQGGIDALHQLQDALGATGLAGEIAAETTIGAWGQAKAELQSLLRDFGEELLPGINRGLRSLLEFYREHEDDVRAFANALGESLGGAIERIDWEQVAAAITRLAESFALFVENVQAFNQELQATGGLGNVFGAGGALEQESLPHAPVPLGAEDVRSAPGRQGAGGVQIHVEGDLANKTFGEMVEDVTLQLLGQLTGSEGG